MGLGISLTSQATNKLEANKGNGVVIDGYKISTCNPYKNLENTKELTKIELIDFCNPKTVNSYKKFGVKDINFNNEYVLIVVGDIHYLALNPKTKEVFTMPYMVLEVDEAGKYKRTPITFKKDKNRICTVNPNGTMLYYDDNDFFEYNTGQQAGEKSCVYLEKDNEKTEFTKFIYDE